MNETKLSFGITLFGLGIVFCVDSILNDPHIAIQLLSGALIGVGSWVIALAVHGFAESIRSGVAPPRIDVRYREESRR